MTAESLSPADREARLRASRRWVLSRCVPLIVCASACTPFAPTIERVVPNDNRVAAGKLRNGALDIHLEAREGRWFPDGDDGPSAVMPMFAELGILDRARR